ncbi:hypothetical protein [Sphingobacterium faecium]|uniref:hypothetical protein n=1 Tax=Sphingobacterium faecium TaxID=34087 RepID=UPI00320B6707
MKILINDINYVGTYTDSYADLDSKAFIKKRFEDFFHNIFNKVAFKLQELNSNCMNLPFLVWLLPNF